MTFLNSLIVPKNLKEGTLGIFKYICCIKKIWKETKIRRIRILSQSDSAEKLERGDPLGFFKLQLPVIYQKIFERKTKMRSF